MEEQQIFFNRTKKSENHTIYVFIVSELCAFYNFSDFFFYNSSVFPKNFYLFIRFIHFMRLLCKNMKMLQQFGSFERKRGAVICKRNIQLIISELEWK